jgi:Citrate lyase beta subunit
VTSEEPTVRQTTLGFAASKQSAEILSAASTFLFVPGNRPGRFSKAVDSGADIVILDLEDSVHPLDKSAARRHVAEFVDRHPCIVRVNSVGTPWHHDDLLALADRHSLVAVMLPKTEFADDVAAVASIVNAPVVALVETASGVARSNDLAATASLARVAFGNLDFSADCDVTIGHDEVETLFARSALVVASRAAGLPGPIDGVFVDIADIDGLRKACRRARRLGFAGKLCLHPCQVDAVRAEFAPSADEIAWASNLLAERATHDNPSLFLFNGSMVDEPVIRRARAIAARSAAGGAATDPLDATNRGSR